MYCTTMHLLNIFILIYIPVYLSLRKHFNPHFLCKNFYVLDIKQTDQIISFDGVISI